ncbi:MAG: hypothetical protein HKP58_18680 [Desulfatitalea sp.]|nr:hypothetical protein [Desulfatitalea sp.]NNK02442.1 hypothetical protein [Desulfatitalea sp.]
MRKNFYVLLRLFSSGQVVINVMAVIFFASIVLSCGPDPQPEINDQKINPRQTHEALFSVSFPTGNDGWACGRWGTVLHTMDGGKKWEVQNSGTDYTLSSIFFINPSHGWAVGNAGAIIHTTDGGNTWEKQKSPVPFRLMKVDFVSPLKGWIVSERTHILATSDGGRTWNIQFADDDFILKSVSFCDERHGWAVGEYGYIYHTENGGDTWQKQSGHFGFSPESGAVVGDPFLFDVAAIDPRTAWAVGIDGHVIKTLDGGMTWTKIETGAPRTQFFCVAANPAGTVLIGGKGTFLASTDNGESWQNQIFEPSIIYGWIYGLSWRGTSEFVAVGWDGSIYFSDVGNSRTVRHRAGM